MTRRTAVILAVGAIAIAVTWMLLRAVQPGGAPRTTAGAPNTATSPASPEQTINATLYFISEDGMSLVGVRREVPFSDSVFDQARQILEAQLGPAPQPFASPVPPGTALRALYVTERGDAFVDLSADARTKHTGGAIDELFTVYAIVDALTVNLPAIRRVQILVEGREVDTLAGHVDLRHPLQKNLQWVRAEKDES